MYVTKTKLIRKGLSNFCHWIQLYLGRYLHPILIHLSSYLISFVIFYIFLTFSTPN